jgi:hypothetical protein
MENTTIYKTLSFFLSPLGHHVSKHAGKKEDIRQDTGYCRSKAVQTASPARYPQALWIELAAPPKWGSSISKKQSRHQLTYSYIFIHVTKWTCKFFCTSMWNTVPGPRSYQLRCFVAQQMTEDRCKQIRPSPSTFNDLISHRIMHDRYHGCLAKVHKFRLKF